jgi:hypothetical protein
MIMGLDVVLDVAVDSLGSEMASKTISSMKDESRLLSNEITISVLADTVTGFSYPTVAMDFEGSLKELIT